jgi:RNA polymerase sigma-70 factor, ECF subfamily
MLPEKRRMQLCSGQHDYFLEASALQNRLNDMTADSAQFAARGVATDDLDLVHASKNGDVVAFEELVRRYDRKLFRIAQNVTHNREDSQDVVQEAFLKAFQHLGDFREDSKFSTWLIRITLNQSLMKLRKQRRIKEVSFDDEFQADGEALPMEIVDWAPNPEQRYRTSELEDILTNALTELRPALRTVFVLRDIEGLSTAETAEALNLSHAAVKARLCRGRLQLREYLNRYFKEGMESGRVASGSGTDHGAAYRRGGREFEYCETSISR